MSQLLANALTPPRRMGCPSSLQLPLRSGSGAAAYGQGSLPLWGEGDRGEARFLEAGIDIAQDAQATQEVDLECFST